MTFINNNDNTILMGCLIHYLWITKHVKMGRAKYTFLVLFMSFANFFFAQSSGGVIIHADQRLDLLVKKQGNIPPGSTSPQMTGYRVQLAFDTDKKTIDDARIRFTEAHPDVDTYVVFNAPNFFLKAGDFRTSLEAEKLKESVTSEFPACFLIKEQVNLPRIDPK